MNSGMRKREIIDQKSLLLQIEFMKTFNEIVSQQPKASNSLRLPQLTKLRAELLTCFQLFKDKRQSYSCQITSLNSLLRLYSEGYTKTREDNLGSDNDSDSDSFNETQDENDESKKKQLRGQIRKSVNKSEQSNIPNKPKGFDSNPLNVWKISEQFFQKLPSNSEIDHLFESKMIDVDIDSLPKHPKSRWISKLSNIADNSKNGAKTLVDPLPQPEKPNFERFWKENPPSFPIEEPAMDNINVFHYLLNSFVDADASEEERNEETSNQNDVLETVIELDSYPLISGVPIQNSYLSLDFQTRLHLELESAGCGSFNNEENDLSFLSEIKDTYHTIQNEYQPEMNRLHDMIMENISEYRNQEDARINSQEIYRLIKSESEKKRSRKK